MLRQTDSQTGRQAGQQPGRQRQQAKTCKSKQAEWENKEGQQRDRRQMTGKHTDKGRKAEFDSQAERQS